MIVRTHRDKAGIAFSNHETAMNQMAARNLAVLAARKARREASNRTLKKIVMAILLVGLFALACNVLYTQQVQCEAKHGSNSRLCVD